VAIKKGDKGMLPFLESLGLNLSSAMHLVKYMKEIFFSSNGNRAIGKNARRMMMHLSIPIDEELQQTMSFLQKIQARRGGLDSLDSGDSYFRYLIESFPRLLSLNVESKMMPKVEFLENSGVPKECMRNILLLFPPIIFYDVEKGIKPRMRAFEKINLGDKDIGRMLVKYPWILSRSIQVNCEEVLSFFEIHKVPQTSVERAVKSWPHILGCSTRNLKMMVEQFDEFGITDKKLGQIIAKSPQLLLQKPKEFLRVVEYLEELELDEESVGKILAKCPEIFNTNIDNILKKKVEFLVDMGIPRKHLPRIIKKYPDLFVCDIDKTLRPRMKFLMQNGHLSKREVGVMVMKFSPILGYSIEEVLRPKLEFLMKTMKVSVTEVVEYPRFFSYSLDKRIKPRFWVLKSRNIKCNLKDMLAKNDDEFATEFILSNPVETE
jgi:mTERF domain-containing protein